MQLGQETSRTDTMLWKLTYLDSLTKFNYGGLFFKFGQILRGTPCNYNVKLPEHANSGEGAGAPITEELLVHILVREMSRPKRLINVQRF